MPTLYVSVIGNYFKASLALKTGLYTKALDLYELAHTDPQFQDLNEAKIPELIALAIQTTLSGVTSINKSKLDIIFLANTEEVTLKFLTIRKSDDPQTQLELEIEEKFKDLTSDENYITHQKLAPFVYQLVAVKKSALTKYLQAATVCGMPLKGVVPWVLLLPRFFDSNDPCIFVIENPEIPAKTIALSELNGIYFAETFYSGHNDEEALDKKITSLVTKLSVYKRTTKIRKVYTLDDSLVNFGDGFQVESLIKLKETFSQAKGFEMHLLAEEVLESNPAYLMSYLNMLTLAPLPTTQKSNTALVYSGTFVASLFLVLGVFMLYSKVASNSKSISDTLGQDQADVLGDKASDPNQPAPVPAPAPEPAPTPELNRASLTVKVENGAGVPGIAAKAKSELESKGYKVSEAGNAATQDYEQTVVMVKSDKKAYFDLVKADLAPGYSAKLSETELATDSDFDLLIILGKK